MLNVRCSRFIVLFSAHWFYCFQMFSVFSLFTVQWISIFTRLFFSINLNSLLRKSVQKVQCSNALVHQDKKGKKGRNFYTDRMSVRVHVCMILIPMYSVVLMNSNTQQYLFFFAFDCRWRRQELPETFDYSTAGVTNFSCLASCFQNTLFSCIVCVCVC